MLAPVTKRDTSILLSELARREVRNSLIYMEKAGWKGKARMDTDITMQLLWQRAPELAEEVQRRINKKKIYSADFVEENWPTLRDDVILDREDAYVKSLSKLGATMAKFEDYGTNYEGRRKK